MSDPMRSPLSSTCLGLLLGVLTLDLGAQIQQRSILHRGLRVHASNSYTGSSTTRLKPVSADVSRGFVEQAQANYLVMRGEAEAQLQPTVTASQIRLRLVLRANSVWGAINWSTYTSYGSAEAAVRTTLTSPVPVAGRLQLQASIADTGSRPFSIGTAAGSIDVGHDGRIELHKTGSRSLDVVIGPQGLPILLQGLTTASNGKGDVILQVDFSPAAGRFQVLGKPCMGPVLSGFHAGDFLHIQADQVPAGRYPLFVLGLQDPRLSLPVHGCLLRSNMLVGLGVLPQAGRAVLDVPLPLQYRGAFHLQFLTVAQGAWVASNGLLLSLP